MQTTAHPDITRFHNEFLLAGTYQHRLMLFDSYFGILPFAFPNFDEQLSFLRVQPAVDNLCQAYKEEGRQSLSLRKVVTHGDKEYVFDVTPVNSLPPVFNEFFISKFIDSGAHFENLVDQMKSRQQYMTATLEKLLQQSDAIIDQLKHSLQLKKRNHFPSQMIKVFFSGFQDADAAVVKTFRYRKKILELYLYAQGVLYCRYRQYLQQHILVCAPAMPHAAVGNAVDWTAQVRLLHRMGMLDLLKARIQETPGNTSFTVYREIVCRIIGQSSLMDHTVGDYLASLDSTDKSEHRHRCL